MKAGTLKVETGDIDHTPEAIEVWAAELRRRFGGQFVAVALEQSRGSLVFMLTKCDHLVIFPVHHNSGELPEELSAFGSEERSQRCQAPVGHLMLHRDKLRRFNPDTQETRALRFLVEERRKFVHERTCCSNRLRRI
jgi:hypothetical protein